MKFTFQTEEGKQQVINHIRAMEVDRAYTVEIKRWRKSRSNQQLAYWWGVVVRTICDFSGNEKDDIHDLLCGEFWGWQDEDVFGRRKLKPVRTLSGPDKLASHEMKQFTDWCIAWAAQHGIMIPQPREVIADEQ